MRRVKTANKKFKTAKRNLKTANNNYNRALRDAYIANVANIKSMANALPGTGQRKNSPQTGLFGPKRY